jgi:Tfp pilus assembly protein PilN
MKSKRIDLIPTEVHDRRARRRHLHLWLGLVTVVLVGQVIVGVYHRYRSLQIRGYVAQASDLRKATRVVRETNEALRVRAQECEQQIARLDLLAGKHRWSEILNWLSARCPPEVVLTHLQVESDASPTGGRRPGPRRAQDVSSFEDLPMPQNLVLSGYAAEHPGLLKFVSTLQESEAFASVSLLQTRRERLGEGEAVDFTVLCRW